MKPFARAAIAFAIAASVTAAVTALSHAADGPPSVAEYKVVMEDLDQPDKPWFLGLGGRVVVFPTKDVCEKVLSTDENVIKVVERLRARFPGRVGEAKCVPFVDGPPA